MHNKALSKTCVDDWTFVLYLADIASAASVSLDLAYETFADILVLVKKIRSRPIRCCWKNEYIIRKTYAKIYLKKSKAIEENVFALKSFFTLRCQTLSVVAKKIAITKYLQWRADEGITKLDE